MCSPIFSELDLERVDYGRQHQLHMTYSLFSGASLQVTGAYDHLDVAPISFSFSLVIVFDDVPSNCTQPGAAVAALSETSCRFGLGLLASVYGSAFSWV